MAFVNNYARRAHGQLHPSHTSRTILYIHSNEKWMTIEANSP